MNEKDFPSLFKSGILTVDGIPEIEIIPVAIVEKYCLDKAKVKEVIDNFESGKWDEMDKFDIWLRRELKKELGLE